jgi:hypothetical protein
MCSIKIRNVVVVAHVQPTDGKVADAVGILGFRSHFRYLSIFIEEKSLTFAERWASFVKIRDRHQKAGI